VKSKQQNNGFKFICIPSAAGPLIIPYKVERSSRVKRMHLQINCPQFVILKLPLRQSETQATRFLQEQGEWIRQTLAAQPRIPPLREYLARHPRVSIKGRWHSLSLGLARGRAGYLVDEREQRAAISLNPRQCSEQQLIALLREMAAEFLPEPLRQLAVRLGEIVLGIAIRDQRCRWGSCSETGAISLNWRLILISPRLQDHVMLHELAHLRHFDHSRAFHRFLKSLDPRSERHARQLDQEASRVIYLGRA